MLNPKLAELREKANNLPLTPGVYMMSDAEGTIIYVGKAKKLKNRVSSYFRGAHDGKVEAMVEKVSDFQVYHVKSEFEALMLENAMIKKYQPHYNILLKDDKGYPFIVLDLKEEWPRFQISSKKKGKTFGPYGGRSVSREIIDSVCQALKLPNCSVSFPQQRPCINKRIGLCEGWCCGGDKEEYRQRIEQAAMILSGESEALIESVRQKMLRASDELNFEYAAKMRDRIRDIENLRNTERVSSGWAERNLRKTGSENDEDLRIKGMRTLELLAAMLNLDCVPQRIEAFDVSNLGDSGIVAAMTCFQDGKPLKSGYRKFRIREILQQDDYYSMYQAVYRRFQRSLTDEKFRELPDLLLIDGGANHAGMAQLALQELGIEIPVFGMVKDDRHRTRALITPNAEEIGISSNQAVFVLIGKIQEETHRFAITYQKSLRYADYGSELDGIPGVGPARKAELLKTFKTVKAVKNATLEELLTAVPKNTANAVYSYFHGGSNESNIR